MFSQAAGEMASKFNARVRALNNTEAAARKAETDIVDSLKKLLNWDIPFDMLKESQAGKPVRRVEVRAGKRSPAINKLARALVEQWMSTVRSGNDGKRSAEEANEGAKGDSKGKVEVKSESEPQDPAVDKVDGKSEVRILNWSGGEKNEEGNSFSAGALSRPAHLCCSCRTAQGVIDCLDCVALAGLSLPLPLPEEKSSFLLLYLCIGLLLLLTCAHLTGFNEVVGRKRPELGGHPDGGGLIRTHRRACR